MKVTGFQWLVIRLTCAVLSAVLNGGLSILVVGARLVGAVTDTAAKVGVVAVAGGITSLTAREAARNGEHVAGEDISIARRWIERCGSDVTYVMQTCPHPGRAASSCAATKVAAVAKRVNEAFMVVVDGDVGW